MTISPSACSRLQAMLEKSGRQMIGYRFDGVVGNCRGSIPLLRPVAAAPPSHAKFEAAGMSFFVARDYEELFADATLDYDGRLFGRGLSLSWPHREGGCPNCR
jgi:Fe-S cluster assembly iron-binding protein IscA